MKIYTRSGDQGETSLFGGERVSKADLRVEAYGSVDELNATIGLARTWIEDEEIRDLLGRIQARLLDVGADLATPQGSSAARAETHIRRVEPAWAKELEQAIDQAELDLQPLHNFVLPGGTPAAAALHQARTICRRAERRVVALLDEQEPINEAIIPYLNRLSDLLFVLARLANQRSGVAETPWHSTGRSQKKEEPGKRE